jgi:hypothetical protein
LQGFIVELAGSKALHCQYNKMAIRNILLVNLENDFDLNFVSSEG